MALTKSIPTIYGIKIEDAYHRVEGIKLDSKTSISFTVSSYADKTKQAISSQPYSCEYDLDGDNPITQAYDFLKTLPEFESSEDC